MPINNISIEPLNPFSNLNSKQIDLYFILKRIFIDSENSTKAYLTVAGIEKNDDGSYSISNEEFATIMCVHPRTVVRALTGLNNAGAIELKYIPDKNGTIRKIYWKGFKNE